MKRFLIAAVVGVFVFSLAAPLFAAEITVRGYSRVRYRVEENRRLDQACPGNASVCEASGNKRNYFDQRVRIAVDARLEENLRGRIETDYSQDFGTNDPFNAPPTGTGTGAGGDTGAVGIRQAWAQAKIPMTPVTIRVGRDTSLGIAHGFVVGETTYGIDQVRASFPLGPAEPWFFYAVATGGQPSATRTTYEEVNVYGVTIPINAGPGVVLNPYALVHHAGAGATTGEKNQYILGAAVDVKQGPMAAWVEAAYNGGRAQEPGFVGGTFNSKVVRRAYFAAAGADFTAGNLKFGLETGLSSGDKNGFNTGADNDRTAKNFDAPVHSHPLSRIQDTIAEPGPGTLGNNTTRIALNLNGIATGDSTTAGNAAFSVCPAAMCGTAVSFSPGQTFVKGSVELKPNPEWTFNGAVSYHQATIVPGGAKRGIGTELYAQAAWQMYRNFRVTAWAAYLFAGPFWTRYDLTDGDPDNPFLSRIYGELTF